MIQYSKHITRFINVFRNDLKQALLSIQFLVAIVGVFFVFLMSSLGYMSEKNYDILFFLKMTLDIGVFTLILPIFSTLPYSHSTYDELHTNNFRYRIVRSDLNTYAISKILTCVISSFFSMFLGVCIFILMMRFRYPLVNVQDIYYEIYSIDDIYGFLLAEHAGIYFLIFIIFLSTFSSIFSVIGLLCSLYFPYKMTIIMAPFIVFFILNEIGAKLSIPFLRISFLMYGKDLFGNVFANIIYVIVVACTSIIVLSKCFLRKLKWKVKNGEC